MFFRSSCSFHHCFFNIFINSLTYFILIASYLLFLFSITNFPLSRSYVTRQVPFFECFPEVFLFLCFLFSFLILFPFFLFCINQYNNINISKTILLKTKSRVLQCSLIFRKISAFFVFNLERLSYVK